MKKVYHYIFCLFTAALIAQNTWTNVVRMSRSDGKVKLLNNQ